MAAYGSVNQNPYFGGSTPSSITASTSDQNNGIPPWLQDYTRNLLGQAVGVTDTGYNAYDPLKTMTADQLSTYGQGTEIAPWDAYQRGAYTGVGANQGSWQPDMAFANQTTPGAIDNYMNPYISQVNDRLGVLAGRNLNENLLPQVNSTFTGAGQFGSTRNSEFNNRAIRDTNESLMGQQAQNLQQGYNTAGQQFTSDATRMASNAGQISSLGYRDTGMLDTAGMQASGQTQKSLTNAQTDFNNAQNFPYQNLSFMSDMVRGLPYNQSMYSTAGQAGGNPTGMVSPLMSAAQAGMGAYSAQAPSSYARG